MPLFTPGSVADTAVAFTDNATNDSSTTKHGFLKKLDGSSSHFMDGTGAWSTPGGGGTLIQEITAPVGGSANIDFTSIPSTYRHLEIFWTGQGEAGSAPNLMVRFNNDSGSNYHWGFWELGISPVTSTSQTEGIVGVLSPTAEPSPTIGRIIVPNYAGTAWNKECQGQFSGSYAGSVRMGISNSIWLSTAAISRITLIPASGDVKEASVFALYGIS